MFIAVLLTGLASAQDCSATITSRDLDAEVQDALLSWAQLDQDGFEAARVDAEADVHCLSEPIARPTAANVHRMHALALFVAGDAEGAKGAFAAALAIEPDYALSAKIAPEGGKLARLYEESKALPAGASAPLGTREDVMVDGQRSGTRATGRPAIVQVMNGRGVSWSGYAEAGAALPSEYFNPSASATVAAADPEPTPEFDPEADLDALAADDPEPEPEPEPIREPKEPKEPREKGGSGAKTGLWVGAIGTGVVAGGLYTVAVVERGSFNQQPTEAAFKTTNATYFGAVGTGVLAAGLATVAIVGKF